MKYFGTDGIRGAYGSDFVCESFFEKLANALSVYLQDDLGLSQAKIAIGTDTRESGTKLKEAFIKGLNKAKVLDFDVVPTPAIALGSLEFNCDVAIVITASHNPYTDNGIKFFDNKAKKISDFAQEKLEYYIDNPKAENNFSPSEVEKVNARDVYINRMSKLLPENALKGKKFVIDTANGATYETSVKVLQNLGAELVVLANSPDGKNINANVGSEHPEIMAKRVVAKGAYMGIAHDGDGDRLVIADDLGNIVSGEEVLAMIALGEYGKNGGKLVTTLQSNMGLDEALKAHNIEVLRCGIGDRLVSAMMAENDVRIGGENSGHYIFEDVSPCGDGLAGVIKVLSLLLSKDKKLSQLDKIVKDFPLISKAIKVKRKIPIEDCPNLAGVIKDCESELNGSGRVLVRYSGTENKIRLLVEGKNEAIIAKSMKKLLKAVENDLQ
ncbi:MAG: phosphoglucosamine mutase [Opitutales bacterium]